MTNETDWVNDMAALLSFLWLAPTLARLHPTLAAPLAAQSLLGRLSPLSPLSPHATTDAAPGNLWLQWNLDPILLLGIALIVGAYFYALGPLRRRYHLAERVDRTKVAYFVAGSVVLTLALVSPLDALSDTYFFSAHMIQHMLISVVVPPLWLLGTPGWMITPLVKGATARRVARWLAHPVLAFGLFNADLWLWHAPVLYDATLTNDTIHIVEHLTFIAFGLLYWLPILSPSPVFPRISRGFGVLYLFIGCQPMVALGALITFAAQPLYQPYVLAPHIWGSTPLGDQQLGGLIMWLPSNIPALIAISVLFFQWIESHDRAERAAAGEFDEFDEFGVANDAAAPTETQAEVIERTAERT
ncbi:MAG TPA: cytochrome c oxidase assembly protein [Ktedonobacterales bacterium]|nr:cytochrome c oxidase assembly protein [Ktedonobacterales bacterium]